MVCPRRIVLHRVRDAFDCQLLRLSCRYSDPDSPHVCQWHGVQTRHQMSLVCQSPKRCQVRLAGDRRKKIGRCRQNGFVQSTDGVRGGQGYGDRTAQAYEEPGPASQTVRPVSF